MTDEQIARIAVRLTEAQRAAISCPKAIPICGMGVDTVILGFQHGRSAKALYNRGLSELPWAPQILTPLGLAIRAHLAQEPGLNPAPDGEL